MKKAILSLFVICLVSCNSNEKIINGELFFKLINAFPSDGSAGKSIEAYLKEIENSDEPEDKKIYMFFSKLKAHDLLFSPSFKLKTNEGVKVIYTTKEVYDKLEKYSLNDLNRKKKKVIIDLKIVELDSAIYFSKEILNIKEVDGYSPWTK